MHIPEVPVSAPKEEHYPPSNRLLEMAVAERPQARLERLGPNALSDTELLALILRCGTRGQDVVTLAARLIADAGSLAGLIAWKESNFQRFKGVGRVKAQQLVTVLEIARRVVSHQSGEAPVLNRADTIAAYFQTVANGLEVEKFWVLCLNRKNRLIKRVEVTSGTATAALAHPREVFREAVREGATAVVCAHNHPSGDPAPSTADLLVTRQLRDASKALDIELLDHVIVGRAAADPAGMGYYSFRSAGLI